ncbi:MAG: WGR domain-containing protein [Synergistaceae bacterium]|jgi:predicted DNA-binding WGR domain protein
MPLPPYDLERWWTREWHKIVPEKDQYRFYRLTLQQNLWGEWELITSWGRIGRKPSRTSLRILKDPTVAESIAQAVDRKRQKRGYVLET